MSHTILSISSAQQTYLAIKVAQQAMTFSDNVAALKKYHGMSVKGMADAIGVCPATIKRALAGRSNYNPTMRTVTRVAVSSGMTIGEILTDRIPDVEPKPKSKTRRSKRK